MVVCKVRRMRIRVSTPRHCRHLFENVELAFGKLSWCASGMKISGTGENLHKCENPVEIVMSVKCYYSRRWKIPQRKFYRMVDARTVSLFSSLGLHWVVTILSFVACEHSNCRHGDAFCWFPIHFRFIVTSLFFRQASIANLFEFKFEVSISWNRSHPRAIPFIRMTKINYLKQFK